MSWGPKPHTPAQGPLLSQGQEVCGLIILVPECLSNKSSHPSLQLRTPTGKRLVSGAPTAQIITLLPTPSHNHRQEARKSLVPVPERLWALRNVANNLVRFGLPAQLPEAVAMLSQADGVARGHYGAVHPARISTLLDLCDALGAVLLQVCVCAGVREVAWEL